MPVHYSSFLTVEMRICIKSGRTYIIILIKFEAASPGDPPEVGGGEFNNVQFEGLLHKHDVVLSHAEAVEVAREQRRAKRDRADLLHFPQCRLFRVFI